MLVYELSKHSDVLVLELSCWFKQQVYKSIKIKLGKIKEIGIGPRSLEHLILVLNCYTVKYFLPLLSPII